MRYLLFIITVIISGCSTSEDESEIEQDIFEPVQIGNWFVSSPERADWTGSENSMNIPYQAESDTVFFDRPDGQTIFLRRQALTMNNRPIGQHILKLDDSVGFQEIDWRDIDHYILEHKAIGSTDFEPNNLFSVNMQTMNIGPGEFELEVLIGYSCFAEIEGMNLFTFNFFRADSTLIKTYQFDTDGFEPTIRLLTECSS